MSVLDTIARERGAEAARRRARLPASELRRLVSAPRPAFGAAGAGPLLIAECKRASPSRGLMVDAYFPETLARAYEGGGAGMVSVLTEPLHFLGDDSHLVAARAAVSVPVLRKDFIVDPWQVTESWALGADVILLIASLHGAASLRELVVLAHGLSLSVLLEIHDEEELDRALASGADAIGVNARDLRDFSVDSARARELGALLGPATYRVAESGMRRPEDAAAMLAAGFRGFLVGEALVTSGDPGAEAARFSAAIAGAARLPGPARAAAMPAEAGPARASGGRT